MRLALVCSRSSLAKSGAVALRERHQFVSPRVADIIIVLGGDGFLLEVLHRRASPDQAIFGMNRGTVGFLMNHFDINELHQRLVTASEIRLNPLRMLVRAGHGSKERDVIALAYNEISLLREKRMAAKIGVWINGIERMEELVCDGVLVATPAGSTAYNMSVEGPILPLGSGVIALTPISAFRPRRWRGAILSHDTTIRLTVREPNRRPVSAVADFTEIRNAITVTVEGAQDVSRRLLFDHKEDLHERIVKEQFML